MFARIRAVSRHLPEGTLSNDEIAKMFPEWSVEKIALKTGINNRHVASEGEYSSDLAIEACRSLFSEFNVSAELFDFLIVITQTPDFILPGISNIVHDAVGLRSSCGSIDINQGCSGYIYGISLAKSLIESNSWENVLVVTTDTYSKLLNPGDKSVRTIFGDGATATWVDGSGTNGSISQAIFGTDGSRAGSLIVPNGGLRSSGTKYSSSNSKSRGLEPSKFDLFMDGPDIFNFASTVVGATYSELLDLDPNKDRPLDLLILHQANAFMLNHLRLKLGLDEKMVPVVMGNWGNTVSGTIPMALVDLKNQKKIGNGEKVMLIGFGVGLSWGGLFAELDF